MWNETRAKKKKKNCTADCNFFSTSRCLVPSHSKFQNFHTIFSPSASSGADTGAGAGAAVVAVRRKYVSPISFTRIIKKKKKYFLQRTLKLKLVFSVARRVNAAVTVYVYISLHYASQKRANIFNLFHQFRCSVPGNMFLLHHFRFSFFLFSFFFFVDLVVSLFHLQSIMMCLHFVRLHATQ